MLGEFVQIVCHHLYTSIQIDERLEIEVEADTRTQNGKGHHKATNQYGQLDFLLSIQLDACPGDTRKHRQKQRRKHNSVWNATKHVVLCATHSFVVENINIALFLWQRLVDVYGMQIQQDVLDGFLRLVKGLFACI